MLKICSICNEEKSPTEFNKNKSKKDGLNTICRECSKIKSRQYYQENTEDHKKAVVKRNFKYRGEIRNKVYDYLEKHPCVDCGITDIRVLEFDHQPQFEKKKDISRMISCGNSWKTIKTEIDKCEVVCANCHRIRTYTRVNSARNRNAP